MGSASNQLQLSLQPQASATRPATNGIQFGSLDFVWCRKACWFPSCARSQQYGSRRYRCGLPRHDCKNISFRYLYSGAHIEEQIPERPPQPQRINLRDIESSAAEKDFFEQNAWANPSVAHAMAQSHPFAPANRIVPNGEAATGIDLLMMSTPVSATVLAGQTPARDSTPSGHRAKSITKLPGNRIDTERIQTSHNSTTTAGTTSTIGLEATETSLPGQTYPLDERKDVFGALGHSVLTAPVGGGGGGTRFPP